jgi:MFS family permease
MLIFAGFLIAAALVPSWFGASDQYRSRLVAASTSLLGAGFGAVVFYASAQTIIQLDSPDHLRGRIMGIWMIVYSGSVPLGSLWTGRAAVALGVDVVMAISAGLCVAAGLLAMATGILRPRPIPPMPAPADRGRDLTA